MDHLKNQCYAMLVDQVPNKGNNLRIKEEEEEEGDCFTDNVCYSTDSDDSTSHNSISDDSAVSYSQNCYNVEEEEGDGIQGETQGSLWKTSVPSRKRSLVYEEVGRPNLSEDLLIYDANNLQISCNEIGLGTILLAPMEAAVDETLSSPSDVRISGFNESQNRSSPM
ncbi:conserved hypothetical protein [Ricinus communis]|uniref:Uncharacterized protein n=1 Tax=Ricinus communis TaxID=3988 RepID=B9SRJ6_RICCO|nr:conserved hypothetical protein [Ricinus communis]